MEMTKSITAQAEAALNADRSYGHTFGVVYAGPNVGWVAMNGAQAASPILVAYTAEDAAAGEFEHTPYQTADARHRYGEAKALIRRYVASQG